MTKDFALDRAIAYLRPATAINGRNAQPLEQTDIDQALDAFKNLFKEVFNTKVQVRKETLYWMSFHFNGEGQLWLINDGLHDSDVTVNVVNV